MIQTAADFVQLRTSDDPADQARASHDEAAEEVWLNIIDSHPDMRRWVAHNKTVSGTVLTLLARDADPTVRWEVAGKRRASADLLRVLALDEEDTVRVRVARNPHACIEELRALVADRSWVVREAAEFALASREGDV